MTKLTALEKLADKCNVTGDAAIAARMLNKDRGETKPRLRAQAYNEGRAAAYNDAHAIMKAELQRLRNMWQNGMIIHASDFDIGD